MQKQPMSNRMEALRRRFHSLGNRIHASLAYSIALQRRPPGNRHERHYQVLHNLYDMQVFLYLELSDLRSEVRALHGWSTFVHIINILHDNLKYFDWITESMVAETQALALTVENTKILELNTVAVEKEIVIERSPQMVNSRASPDRSRIKWEPPPQGWLKLNFDGASKGNPGPSGAGGLVRNHDGEIILAFAENLGSQTSHLAEAKALLQGVSQIESLQCKKLIVEGDYLNVINMLNGTQPALSISSSNTLLEKGTVQQIFWLMKG